MSKLVFGSMLAIALGTAGCTDSAKTATDVSGSWSGTSTSQQQFTLTLAQSGTAITGSGVISPGNLSGRPFSVTVTGAVTSDGGIAITLDTGGDGSVAFTGTIGMPIT